MWLPSPVYERVPQFWLLMGLLFFTFGLYLGFDFQLIFVYLGLGALCITRSAWVFVTRFKFRADPSGSDTNNNDADDSSSHSGGVASF
jgi:hypothetical protein